MVRAKLLILQNESSNFSFSPSASACKVIRTLPLASYSELSSAGEPYLQMCDAKGDARANLSVEGDPRLKFGKDNTVLWSAP